MYKKVHNMYIIVEFNSQTQNTKKYSKQLF